MTSLPWLVFGFGHLKTSPSWGEVPFLCLKFLVYQGLKLMQNAQIVISFFRHTLLRRGSGKTTLLLRGYYECLKTISPKLRGKTHIFGDLKILPIFVDLSNCNDLFSDNDNIEIHFIRQMIESLKRQLEPAQHHLRIKIMLPCYCRHIADLLPLGYNHFLGTMLSLLLVLCE